MLRVVRPSNVNVKLPATDGGHDDDEDDEPCHNVVVEPKYLRPAPLSECYYDEYHHKIPEDHMADTWWAEKEEHWQKMQRMGCGGMGPPRPT